MEFPLAAISDLTQIFNGITMQVIFPMVMMIIMMMVVIFTKRKKTLFLEIIEHN